MILPALSYNHKKKACVSVSVDAGVVFCPKARALPHVESWRGSWLIEVGVIRKNNVSVQGVCGVCVDFLLFAGETVATGRANKPYLVIPLPGKKSNTPNFHFEFLCKNGVGVPRKNKV